MCELETLDDGANRRGFQCAKAAVLQIEIVNDRRKALQCEYNCSVPSFGGHGGVSFITVTRTLQGKSS